MADFKTYLGALKLSYEQHNPTAIAVAKEVYSIFAERQLAEARKQAFEDAERIVYNGGWWAAAEALRREREK